MAIFMVLLSARPCPADETLTLQGASPTLIFDDNFTEPDDDLKTWYVQGNGFGFTIARDLSHVTPFLISPAAPQFSLVIEQQGYIGLGETPEKHIHVQTTQAAPTIRLQSTYAPDPCRWDLHASGNFFGVINASTAGFPSGLEPFRIYDTAPSNTMSLMSGGKVAIGTQTPDPNSHVDIRSDLNNGLLAKRASANAHYLRVENSNSIFRCGVQSSGDAQFGALTAGKGLNMLAGGATKVLINSSGQMSFGNAPVAITTHALVHQSGAVLTSGGVWTSVSSRAAKQDIEPITSAEARDTVRALQPVGYRYKNELDERYVGFIAEDVPELVATNDRKGLAPMDITAVLTKVVQDQQTKLEKQEATIAVLMDRLEALERVNAAAAK